MKQNKIKQISPIEFVTEKGKFEYYFDLMFRYSICSNCKYYYQQTYKDMTPTLDGSGERVRKCEQYGELVDNNFYWEYRTCGKHEGKLNISLILRVQRMLAIIAICIGFGCAVGLIGRPLNWVFILVVIGVVWLALVNSSIKSFKSKQWYANQ